MLNAKGELIELETLSDVVRLLSTKEAKEQGVEENIFRRNGMASIEAVATGLRARGYEVQGFVDGGTKRLRLLTTPGVAAKRRAEAQEGLFPLPPRQKRDQYDTRGRTA